MTDRDVIQNFDQVCSSMRKRKHELVRSFEKSFVVVAA